MSAGLPALAGVAPAGIDHVELQLGDRAAPPGDETSAALAQAGVATAAVSVGGLGDWDAALRLAEALASPLLVVAPAPPGDGGDPDDERWLVHAGGVVDRLVRLQRDAGDAVAVAVEMPRRGTLTSTVEQHRALSRLLVRHRLMLSADVREVAAVGLRVNELWRYFASRIAHIRVTPPALEERPARDDALDGGTAAGGVDLEQWRRLAAMYGYPGRWAIPIGNGAASQVQDVQRAAAWMGGRLAGVLATTAAT